MAAQTVDEYLARVSDAQRAELERIRDIVRAQVPEAEESISYMMPAFKYKKKPLLYYAAFANHLSIFPTSGPTTILADQLTDYETSKDTIKFTLDHPLPTALIEAVVAARNLEIDSK